MDRNYFPLENPGIKKKWLEVILQHQKLHIIVIIVYNDQDSLFSFQIINNYWMRLSMISTIIKAARGWRYLPKSGLRHITPTEALIILDITRKPNLTIILLFA